MMLTVHGLPFKTKFQDVKALIKQECNIRDFILDNLVEDGYDSKKVRIGLTDENDAYRLMKCLEGFRMSGSHVLKIDPVTQPQSTFEQRSNISNPPRNDYPNQTPSYSQSDYNRPRTVNPTSHNSPHGVRNIGDTRHDRGMIDSRPSLTQVTNHPQDSRDHYESSHRREDTRSDFRDHNRGPLVTPTLRPASLNTLVHGIDSRNLPSDSNMRGPERPGIRGQDVPGVRGHDGVRGLDVPSVRGQDGVRGPQTPGMRGSDRPGMRAPDAAIRSDIGMRGDSYQKPDHRQVSNADMNRQPQWSSGGNNQWSDAGRPMQNQSTGYNFPQGQENAGYGQQPIATLQGGFPTRGPQTYQQPSKPALAPERPLAASRSHVLRSVDIVDTPTQPRAQTNYPQMQNPMSIVKDNFQGPAQYISSGAPPTSYQAQGAPQPWSQLQGSQSKQPYDDRHLEKAVPKAQDYDKLRFSPPRAGRPASPGRRSPPRNIQSTNRPQSYSDRRVSPSRPFRLSPNRHAPSRFSPTRRDMSPKLGIVLGRNSPRKMSPRRHDDRRSPRRISPFSRKISPPRRISPSRDSGRRVSPFGRKVSPTGQRRISPTGQRRISPTGQRRISPTGQRRISPIGQRRISPFGRKVSPTGQRRISPFGRKASPPGQRRISPFGRKMSPGRRVSPKRDELRRASPSMMKYDYYVEGDRRMGPRDSPSRRYSPKRSPLRGAGRYSPTQMNYGHDDKDGKGMPNRSAYEAKQAQKYTGAGFRPIEGQYPPPARNDSKISPWQTEKDYPSKDEARANPLEEARKKLSPRRSRSRSPGKDRFRRHSPSPRSPRRSWALEKRRSPEILPPPPPLWPGQDEDKPKHPIWERNVPERFDDKHRNEEKFGTRAPRFSPRRDTAQYTDKLGDYREDQYRKSPRDEKKLFHEVDKDFNDIYQRAVEFRRKTEELRKSNEHRTRYDDEDQRRDKSLQQEKSKPTWIPVKPPTSQISEKDRNQMRLETSVKEKRDKASEEIALQILESHNFSGEQRLRVMDELKFSVFNIMLDMFKDKDVSYIELVIKFRAKYDAKDEEKILMDVLASMPSHYKNSLKRKGDDITELTAKMSRPTPAYSNAVVSRRKLADSVNKYSSHGSAWLKNDSRKRIRDERDDRVVRTRKMIKTEDNRGSRPDSRSHRIPSPTYKERKYVAPALNEYLDAYDNQPKKHLEEKAKNYAQAKVYKSNPVTYLENEHRKKDNQPTFNEHKPKVPRIQEINPKVQDVIVEETMPVEKPQSVADRTRPFRFNELNPLMNSMVEDELKNMMINLGKRLPDDAPNDAEKFVLDKIKNEVFDELRNTMGLNVTKRLLNVSNESSHKGLLIKIQMSSSVSSRDVYELCKTYQINELKNLQPRMYAGRVLNWTQLDELYSVKDLTCGKSKVTITPIYNFLKCPPMLKTVFDGKQQPEERKTIITADPVLYKAAKKEEAKKGIISKDKAIDKKAVKTEPKKTDYKESPKNVPPKTEDKKPATKPSQTTDVQKETLKRDSTKTDSKVTNTKPVMKEVRKGEENKQASKTVAKAIPITATKEPAKTVAKEPPKTGAKDPPKTGAKEPGKTVAKEPPKTGAKEPAKTVDKEPPKTGAKEPAKIVAKEPLKAVAKEQPKTGAKEPGKTVAKEPPKTGVKEPAKTVAKEPPKTGPKEPPKTGAEEPPKTVSEKPAKTANTEPAKPIAKEPSKPVAHESTKPISKEAKPTAGKPAPAKKETFVTPKPPEKKAVDAKAKNKSDDFDELDDHDILALLSSGIVLDTCSGSDDD